MQTAFLDCGDDAETEFLCGGVLREGSRVFLELGVLQELLHAETGLFFNEGGRQIKEVVVEEVVVWDLLAHLLSHMGFGLGSEEFFDVLAHFVGRGNAEPSSKGLIDGGTVGCPIALRCKRTFLGFKASLSSAEAEFVGDADAFNGSAGGLAEADRASISAFDFLSPQNGCWKRRWSEERVNSNLTSRRTKSPLRRAVFDVFPVAKKSWTWRMVSLTFSSFTSGFLTDWRIDLADVDGRDFRIGLEAVKVSFAPC